ncbi:MAG: hypothetical protein HY826_10240 [Actinobacteria bacterium]|nr:hypothetical protein [Actinomycetota bacterium]
MPTAVADTCGMRRRSDDKWMEPEQAAKPFLDPESIENSKFVAVELRERLDKVEEQVLAQFSSTATYTTLAQQGAEHARAEARADHERLQTTIIGLLDRLRAEMRERLDALEARTVTAGASGPIADAARIAELEERTNVVITALHAYGQENVRLRQQVDELLAKQMRTDGWLVSSGGTSDLALR